MISVLGLFLISQENLAADEASDRIQAVQLHTHLKWIWDYDFFH